MKESSTIRNGIRLLVITIGFLGFHITPELESQIVILALAISSIIGIIFPDNLNKSNDNSINDNSINDNSINDNSIPNETDNVKNNNEIISSINTKTEKDYLKQPQIVINKENRVFTNKQQNKKQSINLSNKKTVETNNLSGFNNK
ncbi:MAG: hypothetical protein KC550_05125 [Nanoarchaeota archaeon]|nr:hypothetical protein [Nanoarchaeota archaeon]